MHFSNFYPQWGSVDPWWCYWLCITSSCPCHPTKIAPSMFCHDVATSLTPFDGFQMPPRIGNYFPAFFLGQTFSLTGSACAVLFGAKTHWERTYCLNFQLFNQNLLCFYAVMAEASANVYRVNKLVEIEAADWQRQLERAVGGSFSLDLVFRFFNFQSLAFNFPR